MEFLSQLTSYVTTIVIIAYALSIFAVIVMITLENRSPLKALAWILVLLLLPGLGLILYVFFGQNLRKEKIIARKGLKNIDALLSLANGQIEKLTESSFLNRNETAQKRNIIRLLLNSNSSLVTIGNKVTPLQNGEVTFEHIINAIKNAKEFIHLVYYILEEDTIGNKIIDLLIEKAKEGIEIRLIVDDVGSWELKQNFFDKMALAGIETESFLKVRFPYLTSKVNYRNHRKIIVIDGTIGFMGGINIADRYISGSTDYGTWRDTHVMIEGDAVNTLQTIFIIDWYFVKQIELSDPKYFPLKKPVGDKVVQIASSGPDSDWPSIMMAIFESIATAQQYIYFATPYFMPSEGVLLAIKTAALGGVDVRILLPYKSDAVFTLLSTRSYIKELLECNVKIYFYKKGFLHSKVFVCDDVLTSIGSANLDFRSFEQNFEVMAFVYDTEIALETKATFMKDIEESQEIDLQSWAKRPNWEKAKESFARLFSPLL